ncbi:MAG: nickel pincer cofactor biosynthesis protein LarB [Dehalococcoidia bacterium]|tara:strand:- start:221 stop:976 length:756 start_codon:yes stop_codon:yes gene_type:complete
MKNKKLYELLELLYTQKVSPEEIIGILQKEKNFSDSDFVNVDLFREMRVGFPEVIFGLSKTPKQVLNISTKMFKEEKFFLVTRSSLETYKLLKKTFNDVQWSEISKTIWLDKRNISNKLLKGISIVSAGTSDLPFATEAKITAELMGCKVKMITDVGVAGIHRLLTRLPEISQSKVIIVVAGMEGALPSVLSGLVKAPIIALPTSVGYGANLNGISAFLTMLNSCSPGISTVNIDNGFGAGYQAASIVKQK